MSNVEGLDKLLKDLDKLPDDIWDDINKETEASAITIHRNAATAAPINKGKHGGSLRQVVQIDWINCQQDI